ncbi:hypothetical protein GV794_23505 [Nocardia cyriacigeorgica]|uniref:XRE family transcriptional regulator n=2 Tax=Nocardia cyriacigeorgica TaxID=135487 RepID=A0ABX0CRV8_9NOCA|nr:hypothetical protein [Nocardia cyriacigeorgica]
MTADELAEFLRKERAKLRFQHAVARHIDIDGLAVLLRACRRPTNDPANDVDRHKINPPKEN